MEKDEKRSIDKVMTRLLYFLTFHFKGVYSLLYFNYSIYIIFFISGYSSFLKFTEEEIIILVLMAIHQQQG